MIPYHAFWFALAIACFSTIGAVSVPGCQAIAPQQKNLSDVHTALISVPTAPFGLVYSRNDDIAFVALNNTLGVLNTTTFTPTLLHQIKFPAAYTVLDGAGGITLTHDGRHVIVSVGSGALVFDVVKAVAGSSAAVVGALNGTAGTGAIEAIVTSDDKYVFVSQEYGTAQTKLRGGVEVFTLDKPTTNGSVSGSYVGFLPLGDAVVGTAFSPNGSILYATSEISELPLVNETQGSLSLIDVEKLKTNPTDALISNTTIAGCSPVRVAVSAKEVWVTARESNRLLAFDAAKLLSSPENALIASVQVGTSPVGLIFAKNGSRILTADSNRFLYTNTTSGISVVDVQAALQGKQALLGRIPTGKFPRELAISPDKRTILVSDYYSAQVQAVDVDSIP
jgi:DNA-binding beta-propeller fold protein YncE